MVSVLRPVRRLAITVAALSATAALSMDVVAVSMWLLIAPAVAPVNRTGCTTGGAPLSDAAVTAMAAAFLTCVLASLAAAGTALVWIWRARANAEVIGAVPQRLSRFWSAACWLVPVANVVLPPRVLGDVWAASCTDRDRHEHLAWVRLIRVWWVAQWTIIGVVMLILLVAEGMVAIDVDDLPIAEDLVVAVLVSLITVASHGAAALFTAIVLRISTCQTAARRPLGVPSIP
jgi:uncharacterized protein DUF4328